VPAARRVATFGLLAVLLVTGDVWALGADQLGVLYRRGDARSEEVARFYQRMRHVPEKNMLALRIPDVASLAPDVLTALRERALRRLPGTVQALLLVWTRPYAVACMSSTSAFALGYDPSSCGSTCAHTAWNRAFAAQTDVLSQRRDLFPAMQLPSDDVGVAKEVIRRGVTSDATYPAGVMYLVVTGDQLRNVRAQRYQDVMKSYSGKVGVRIVREPGAGTVSSVLTYFTGAARVRELGQLRFLPGGIGDHLSSYGGNLDQHEQTTVLDWLSAGATGSYGSVSEPCNDTGKFPSPLIFIKHYLRGETLLEAYWKSVAMPAQGLFVGEPLAAPYRGARPPSSYVSVRRT